eukprot:302515-Chlamydomonas_euryale.AAC.1
MHGEGARRVALMLSAPRPSAGRPTLRAACHRLATKHNHCWPRGGRRHRRGGTWASPLPRPLPRKRPRCADGPLRPPPAPVPRPPRR